ncbi:acyl carrier protein [Pseudonocardia sp. MCCB 268]|nr:acyl carrier protein [Pseudonocardia cytotoxica]
MRAAFARVFGLADVPGDATFRDLGGDSLRYVQMSTALTEILGDPPADWPGRTVAELGGRGARRRRKVRTSRDPGAAARGRHRARAGGARRPGGRWAGAPAPLALAGWSFARFTPATAVSRRLLGTALRIAVPTVPWLSWRVSGRGRRGAAITCRSPTSWWTRSSPATGSSSRCCRSCSCWRSCLRCPGAPGRAPRAARLPAARWSPGC